MSHWWSIKPQTVVLPGDLRLDFRKPGLALPTTLEVQAGGKIYHITFDPAGEVRRIQQLTADDERVKDVTSG